MDGKIVTFAQCQKANKEALRELSALNDRLRAAHEAADGVGVVKLSHAVQGQETKIARLTQLWSNLVRRVEQLERQADQLDRDISAHSFDKAIVLASRALHDAEKLKEDAGKRLEALKIEILSIKEG